MAEIGVYEAKTHLARLLAEVEAGASITITRNGRDRLVLMSAEAFERMSRFAPRARSERRRASSDPQG